MMNNDSGKNVNAKFERERTDATGRVRPDLWSKGIEYARQMKIAAGIELARKTDSFGGVTGVQWTQIGPALLRIDAEPSIDRSIA